MCLCSPYILSILPRDLAPPIYPLCATPHAHRAHLSELVIDLVEDGHMAMEGGTVRS